MGRDVEDWTILDAQANQPVRGGIGWARSAPAGHEFVELPWEIWGKLSDAAAKGNTVLFESILVMRKDAWQVYRNATNPDRQAIRDLFAAVVRRS